MPKKKPADDQAATLERFERALRNALSTPPEKTVKAKKKAAAKPKRKS